MTPRTASLAAGLVGLLTGCTPEGDGRSPDPCRDPLRTAPGTICTYVGLPGVAQFAEEGLDRRDSALYLPIDLTSGPDGLLYLSDWNNHRIRRVEEDGTVHTLAGTGTLGDGPEGPAAAASFNHPTNLKFRPDDPDRLVLAAWHNSRIEELDLGSRELWFVAGTGERSFSGDGKEAAVTDLDLPSSIEFDADGETLYFSDTANQIVRAILPDGTVRTVAGTVPAGLLENGETDRRFGWEGDGGPATEARLNMGWGQRGYPGGRIARFADTLYVCDTYNFVVRAVDLAAGTIRHVAGTGLTSGYGGDGGPAADAILGFPTDVAVDADGALYIADTFNHCVRRVDPDGTIDTVAGVCAEPGDGGDGGPATAAHLLNPFGVDVDADFLWIADTENHVLRAVRR